MGPFSTLLCEPQVPHIIVACDRDRLGLCGKRKQEF